MQTIRPFGSWGLLIAFPLVFATPHSYYFGIQFRSLLLPNTVVRRSNLSVYPCAVAIVLRAVCFLASISLTSCILNRVNMWWQKQIPKRKTTIRQTHSYIHDYYYALKEII